MNVGALIRERVEPLADRYVKGFNVRQWLETRPDVQRQLDEAETDVDAMRVLQRTLRPYLEENAERPLAQPPHHCSTCTCPASGLFADEEKAVSA